MNGSRTRSLVVALLFFVACRTTPPPSATPPPASPAPSAGRVIEGVTFSPDASLLFLTPEQQRVAYRHVQDLAPVNLIARGSSVTPLDSAPVDLSSFRYEFGGQQRTLEEYIERGRVAGLLVLRNGRIAAERYEHGNGPESVWSSFSVAKSVLSVLYGAALLDGAIGSLDDSVAKYLPAMRGTPYEAVSLRTLLQMSSGVSWNEEESDRRSDLAQLGRLGREGGIAAVVDYLSHMPRVAEPGTVFNYNTGETLLAGAVLRAATGKSLASYLSEKVWQPAGMERDGYWVLLRPDDLEFGGCCISATLRDYGRFGQFVLDNGVTRNGQRMLPADWMTQSTTSAPTMKGYGFLWWLREGRYAASGSFGQLVQIDPERRTVVVIESLWPAAFDRALNDERTAFAGALSHFVASAP